MSNTEQWRLSKFISLFANISRNEAEKDIGKGLVTVNSSLPKNSAVIVTSKDFISYKKRRILASKSTITKAEEVHCYALYKPVGVIVTRSDEKNRQTVYSLLPKEMSNFHYVGRLDFNSEGLLFFTNNAQFARNIENPKHQIPRTYHVKAYGMIDEKKLNRMQKGVIIEGISHKPESIKILPRTKENSANTWLEITLITGKNREIRKLLEHFNLKVVKLIRFSFGEFTIKDFNKEKLYKLNEREIKKLQNFIRI
jgi:23S rRNA pseudouridine2605 synthase